MQQTNKQTVKILFFWLFTAGIASIVGFQVNRSNTLYEFALRERKSEYE